MEVIQFYEMIGRRVSVCAGDIVYSGILIEVTEENIELQGDNQWLKLPLDNINSVTLDLGIGDNYTVTSVF